MLALFPAFLTRIALTVYFFNDRFIAVTDNNTFVTPFNLSEINQHIVAGPAMYMAG
jgi:hypothetical protein